MTNTNTSHPWFTRSRVVLVICFLCVIAGIALHQVMLFNVQKQIEGAARTSHVVALENRVTELNASVSELANKPVFDASRHEADMKALETQQAAMRQDMTEQIAVLESSVKERLASPDLAAIKRRIKTLETHVAELSRVLAEPAPDKQGAQNARVERDESEPPFKVIDIEVRGGAHFVVIDDAEDAPRALYPGDVERDWRLDEIDERTAVFQRGEVTHRVTLPALP
jgi:predicted DNA binding CopG/RHH family protein